MDTIESTEWSEFVLVWQLIFRYRADHQRHPFIGNHGIRNFRIILVNSKSALPISTSQMSSSFTKKFYDKKLYQKLYQTCKTNRSNDGDNDSEAPRIAERSGEKKAVKGKVDVYKPYDACYEMFYEILAESSSVDVNWSNHKRWPHRRGALNF